MNNKIFNKAKTKGINYKFVNIDNLINSRKVEFSQLNITDDGNIKKTLLEKRINIENMLKNMLTSSKENIKSTVPIINNVNKQLMQDNILLKIRIENIKQTYKNIINYCVDLKKDIDKDNKSEIDEVINCVLERLKCEMQKIKKE